MDKLIFLGEQPSCLFPMMKMLIENPRKNALVLSVKSRGVHSLNTLIWSKLEFTVFKKVVGLSSTCLKELKPLELTIDGKRIYLNSNGRGNLFEIFRKFELESDCLDSLIEEYPRFASLFNNFENELIKFGQYNNLKMSEFLEVLPKSFKNLFLNLEFNPSLHHFIISMAKIIGPGINYGTSKTENYYLLGKILSGVGIFSLTDMLKNFFKERITFKSVPFLEIQDIGESSGQMSFGGYEGKEIAGFNNLYASEEYSSTHLKKNGMNILKKKGDRYYLGEDSINIEVILNEKIGVDELSVFHRRSAFISSFVPNSKKFAFISGVRFNLLETISSNSFGVSPYLTYLCSLN